MSENHRPLSFILFPRKIFEMAKILRLVRDTLDKLQPLGCNDKLTELTPIAVVVSVASLRYVLTILLEIIKAYDLVQWTRS